MAEPKLTEEQQLKLIQWLAADYSEKLIRVWMERDKWPKITHQAISYYRQMLKADIDTLRSERRSRALTTGLALKEERVERLKVHADDLEEIKWVPDEKGKLHNEKAWRETLDDIAKEMGHRRSGVDLNGNLNVGSLSDAELIARVQGRIGGDGPQGPDPSPDESG